MTPRRGPPKAAVGRGPAGAGGSAASRSAAGRAGAAGQAPGAEAGPGRGTPPPAPRGGDRGGNRGEETKGAGGVLGPRRPDAAGHSPRRGAGCYGGGGLQARRYVDRLERRDGQWRIAVRRATVDAVVTGDASMLGHPVFRRQGYIQGARNETDVSYRRPASLDGPEPARW